ncbi:MAG TPA: hypothetical protein VHV49_05565 [Pseudonocardiaceae bacterium]|jgi:pimeloyl-ACP methyl ester carboxylesterase|nr:hypothetical protein [Pseudonocardiaceae bacterium]
MSTEPRAAGPAVVRRGPSTGPTVVVLDPHGDARHAELPATWRPLAEDVRVVWWRLPAATRQGSTIEALAEQLTAAQEPVHLVGAGDAALHAVLLAARCRALVRSLVLVDPPWPAGSPLGDLGSVMVQHLVTGERGAPLGHPDVVAAVLEALVSADLWPGNSAPTAPESASLAGDAVRALWVRLGELWSAVRPGS